MAEERKYINWTPEKLERFKEAQRAAVLTKRDVFTFEGNEFVSLLTQAVEAEVAGFLIKHADLKTEGGLSRVVRHGHLPSVKS